MNYAEPRTGRPRVAVTEVGTRDGFQSEPEFIPTDGQGRGHRRADRRRRRAHRGDVVRQPARGAAAGRRARGAGARRAPRRRPHRRRWCPTRAAPSARSGAGVDEMVCFVSASETHNQANLNAPIAGSLANVAEVAAIARGKARRCAARSRARSAARSRARCRSTRRCASSTPTRRSASTALTLGDTTGMATPPTVARLVEAIGKRFPAAARSRCTSTTRAASGSPT